MKRFKFKKIINRYWFIPIVTTLIIAIILVLSATLFLAYYQDKIFPGVKIASFDLSGKTLDQSNQLLTQEFSSRLLPLELTDSQQTFTLDPTLASPKINTPIVSKKAYLIGRSGDYLRDIKDLLKSLFAGTTLTLELNYNNTQAIFSQIEAIDQAVKKDPIEAKINITNLEITPSEDGKTLDKTELFNHINNYLSLNADRPSQLPIKTSSAFFNTTQANLAKKSLSSVKLTPLKLSYDKTSWSINERILFNLLNTTGETDDLLDDQKLTSYLEDIAGDIFQPVKNARFNLDPNTKRVSEFQQAENGLELDLDQTKKLVLQAALDRTPHEISLPVKVTKPTITASNATDFGIDGLLAEGVSHFAGSIPNRIYNVGLAASRINGVLIAPNETFSFDNTIGDVSSATGYKQAYVIKSGRTVLDDGGGVCQVSTTLFRAVLNAGLPVVARTAHAYRVGYYEQGFSPGLDATIFYPSVDFKFKNDTGKYILIQTRIEGTSLYIDLYGQSDGREVALTKPIITNQTPPPPDLRQDDPTLSKGVVKQVDWAAPGATVVFKRTVTRNGETLINETYTSNYRPWQAVYLVGTM